MTSKALVRTTLRPSFYALVLKHTCTRGIASLTCSSSHEELSWPGTFRRNHTTATPTVGGLFPSLQNEQDRTARFGS